MPTDQPLWTPSPARRDGALLARFTKRAESLAGREFPAYRDLHAWSVADRGAFWSLVWDFCEVVGDKGGTALAEGGSMMEDAFFPRASLNFAENLLRREGGADAVVFRCENGLERRLSWDALRALVSRLQQALLNRGVGPGDRVAAVMPNMPETVAAMLAAASIGAVWSSCSPDFGERSIIDRFGQIEPKVLFCVDGYNYAGKRIDLSDRLAAVEAGLPGRPLVVVVDLIGTAVTLAGRAPARVTLEAFIAAHEPAPLRFTRMPFDHPLAILFSSGTTGLPKCIVHGAGGTLLQHLKEHRLHSDIREDDRVFYFSTCGWMMWNWLVSALASGATILLYDGSPAHPSPLTLFDYAEREAATFFGTSAKFIDGLRAGDVRPVERFALESLRTVASTGSPLGPSGFRSVYENVKADLHLASISGGTDIVSCFVLGVPTEAVWAGEIQAPGLGMAVDVWDDEGRRLPQGKGELVCTRAFPCMPVGFWNDPDGARYRAAYFKRFAGVWCHGDYAEWTAHGGIIIHGRSDATLNPGGVRIGTAEIYNQIETMPEILEAVCVGQQWEDDVRVLLFVRLAEGCVLDETRLRARIREGASPRHVPARIIVVPDIHRTVSGKISEIAVRNVIHGIPITNVDALANPESLTHFRECRSVLSS